MMRQAGRLLWRALAVPALLAAGATGAPLRAAPADQQDAPVFGTDTAMVLVDVVVRDKKGGLVRDMQPSDFEIYEDREKQTISIFRVIDLGTNRSPATAPNPPTAAEPLQTSPAPSAASQPAPAVIAFLFDQLSPAARDTARRAALAYTNRGHIGGDLVGVFSVDVALHVLQPFTTDMQAVRAAFERAGRQAQTQDPNLREDARVYDARLQKAETRLAAIAQGSAGPEAAALAPGLAVGAGFDLMRVRMLNAIDRLGRDQQGFGSTNALMAVVDGLKTLAGRKTIVFFSEGLQISSNLLTEFRSVIATANRANVTVYAIDAAGLRLDSVTKDAREEVVAMGARRLHQEQLGLTVDNRPLTEGLERAEDAARQAPHAGLSQLAEETGGFLLADTNDASRGFDRIQEEMRFYYLLSYAPTNPSFDGTFRSIAVKVRRPGVAVYTRKGYLAVRPDISIPVRTYEAPVIAALERVPPPTELPLHAAALSFPEGKRVGRVPVMVELPGSALTYTLDEKRKVYAADFSIVARVRDWQGREVDRLGRHYPLTIPASQIDAVRRGDVLFFKETDLPPGHYTLEAAAYDALGRKASVCTTRVEVGAATQGGPRLSSLVLLQRVEKLSAAELGRDNPLYFGETIVYPHMGKPYSKSAGTALGFFFTVYTDGLDAAAPTQASLDILKDGRPAARAVTALGTPDGSGRIQQAGALPIEGLSPGDYTLRLSVANGSDTVYRQADFVVEP